MQIFILNNHSSSDIITNSSTDLFPINTSKSINEVKNIVSKLINICQEVEEDGVYSELSTRDKTIDNFFKYVVKVDKDKNKDEIIKIFEDACWHIYETKRERITEQKLDILEKCFFDGRFLKRKNNDVYYDNFYYYNKGTKLTQTRLKSWIDKITKELEIFNYDFEHDYKKFYTNLVNDGIVDEINEYNENSIYNIVEKYKRSSCKKILDLIESCSVKNVLFELWYDIKHNNDDCAYLSIEELHGMTLLFSHDSIPIQLTDSIMGIFQCKWYHLG